MKILSVVGARPQFIKAAVLNEELARRPGCDHVLVHTGQHYDFAMSQIFFDELPLPQPARHLEVGSGTHGAQTGEALRRLEPVLLDFRPDVVVVFGDTNSTLAGALAAVKLGLPVAHVEAGLRSFDRTMPEEINRIVTDHICAQHFVPNDGAGDQLLREGISSAGIFNVGDLMIDLALRAAAELPKNPAILSRLNLASGSFALATVHRAANTDDPAAFARIVAALRRLAEPVVFPVHPRSKALAARNRVGSADNIVACEPVSYREMIALERHARVILTDSGGVQKEAFALGVPCVTLRSNTEWTETLAHGWNVLAGSEADAIVQAAARPRPLAAHGYAECGRCATSICDALEALYGDGARGRAVELVGQSIHAV